MRGYGLRRRHLGRWVGAAALAPWLPSCGGSGTSNGTTPREESYIKVVESIFTDYQPPGILAGVHTADEPPWMQAFGQADLAQAVPISLSSTFPIRSITKSFTVTLLLQLVQSGQLALDHKIDRYMAGVPNGGLIDLADLAGNQSGLADYSMQPGFLRVFAEDTLHVWTPQELADFSFAVTPPFLPGQQYQYSNTNTLLLGMVIEAVTRQPLANLLEQKIFNPLGMGGTTYPSLANLPSPTPTPYSIDITTGETEELPLVSPTALAGAGAVASTLSDLLAWGKALGQGSLISPELQALRKSRSRDVTNGPEYDRYGLGIGQIGNWWGHTGTGIGFQIATMNLASSGATISVLVNATPEGGRRDLNLAQELFERLAVVVEST